MEKYLKILADGPLFAGIAPNELASLLGCLNAVQKRYVKNSHIFMAGDKVAAIGLMLSGRAHILQDDFWGNRSIIAQLTAGDLFAEAFCCAGVSKMPVSVMAAEDADILLIDYSKIITPCSAVCDFHKQLISNMLGIVARKNVMLTQKIEHATRRRTREKLLSYLSSRALTNGTDTFKIPFNRQELADYLAVERSAMCAELSKMRDEGLLDFKKNSFTLLH